MINKKQINQYITNMWNNNPIMVIVLGIVFLVITFCITDCTLGASKEFTSNIESKLYEPPYTSCSTGSDGEVSCSTVLPKYIIGVNDNGEYVAVYVTPIQWSIYKVNDSVICNSTFGLTGVRYLTTCKKIN